MADDNLGEDITKILKEVHDTRIAGAIIRLAGRLIVLTDNTESLEIRVRYLENRLKAAKVKPKRKKSNARKRR